METNMRTTLEWRMNLTTVKAPGITTRERLLLRADRVIE
jgi:hypothetical protein